MRLGFLFAWASIFCASIHADAAEIKVLASGAVQHAYEELIPRFEAETGNKVVTSWSSTVLIVKLISEARDFDLVIVGAPEIDSGIAQGRLVAGSRLDLARSGVGMAVRKGAPMPDVSTPDALRAALLKASAIGYSTGASGVYIPKLLANLGIAEQTQTKLKQTQPGRRVARSLADGEVEFGFQQISELVHEDGIIYLGPLPPEIQNHTNFSSGIRTEAAQGEAARALQRFLVSARAQESFRRNGFE